MTKVNCCKDFLSLIEEYTLSRPEIQNPPKNFVKSKKKKEIEDKQTKTTEIRSLFLVTSFPPTIVVIHYVGARSSNWQETDVCSWSLR